jgi:20S proteasome alpha/beta subunit
MTFVVGLACHAGIVLCSDSWESDGVSKRDVPKLHRYDAGEEWGLAWGCSGDTDVCTQFSDKLRRVLGNEHKNKKTGKDMERLRFLVESVAMEIHQDYSQAKLAIVVAIWQEVEHLAMGLFSMNVQLSNCLARTEPYACAGMDLSLGRFILDNTCNRAMATGEGIGLAVFVTKLMKDTADGVGGPLQLLTYRLAKSEWQEYEQDYIDSVEKKYSTSELAELVRDYWGKKNPLWIRPLEGLAP